MFQMRQSGLLVDVFPSPPGEQVAEGCRIDPSPPHAELPVTVLVLRRPVCQDRSQRPQYFGWDQVESGFALVVFSSFGWSC